MLARKGNVVTGESMKYWTVSMGDGNGGRTGTDHISAESGEKSWYRSLG